MPTIEQDNWSVSYERSASTGVRLGKCDYQHTRVLHAAAVPFVYVKYQGAGIGPFTDELRSVGGDIDVRQIIKGFDIRVRYDLYGPDYEYDHIWRFHDDGQFGSAVVIHGPGEEIADRHTYHVPFRFDLDISGRSGDSFQTRHLTGAWNDVEYEGGHRPHVPWATDYHWRVIDKKTGRSARVRGRSGDDAELWALSYDRVESWSAWGGAQAGVPGSPGSVPAIYQNGQRVQDTDIVLWYLAHIPSRDRVTACGPWFALDGFPPPETDPDDDHGHDHGHHGGPADEPDHHDGENEHDH